MLKLGDRTISKLYLSQTAVSKAYLGSKLVYSAAQPLPYDAEVAYLESTGTQYIKVGTIIGATAVEARLAATSIPDSGCYKAFGIGYQSNFRDDAGINNVGWCSSANVPLVENEFVLLRYDANGRYVNGTSIGLNGRFFLDAAADGNSLFLFCGSSGTNAYITSSGNYMAWRGKIASYSVVGEARNLRDFIPVRFTNEQGVSEGAMYDRVSKRLFRNSGSGSFEIGPDKVPMSAGLYVADGLVAQWDGRENAGRGLHSSAPSQIEDLAGSSPLALNNVGLGVAIGDSWFAPNNVRGGYAKNTTTTAAKDAIDGGAATIEVCVKCDSYQGATLFGCDDNTRLYSADSQLLRWLRLKGGLTNVAPAGMPLRELKTIAVRIGGDGNALFLDGAKKISALAVGAQDIAAGFELGFGSAGSYKFYSARIYNRALTDEEIAANAAIDKDRFGEG